MGQVKSWLRGGVTVAAHVAGTWTGGYDHFWVLAALKGKLKSAWIEPGVMGSNHFPVGVELKD